MGVLFHSVYLWEAKNKYIFLCNEAKKITISQAILLNLFHYVLNILFFFQSGKRENWSGSCYRSGSGLHDLDNVCGRCLWPAGGECLCVSLFFFIYSIVLLFPSSPVSYCLWTIIISPSCICPLKKYSSGQCSITFDMDRRDHTLII